MPIPTKSDKFIILGITLKILRFVGRAFFYNLVNKANLVQNFS